MPLPDKVRAICDFPKPTNVKSLQEFLGMLNYYHRILPNLASTLAPLHRALAGRKKYTALSTMNEAFLAAEDSLADATFLVHPAEDALTALTVDASQFAIGADLEHTHKRSLANL